MTNPKPAAPIVVIPTPGVPGLAVALTRDLRDAFGREFMGGTTYGFEEKSAVSIVAAGYGSAFCFDDAAAERWTKALRESEAFKLSVGDGDGFMERILSRFSGPAIDKAKADRAAYEATLAEADRLEAVAKQTREAQLAAEQLAADQLAAEAAEKAKLQEEAAKAGNESVPVLAGDVALASNAEASGDALAEPEPKPTPPAPTPDTKRGNKTPRGK